MDGCSGYLDVKLKNCRSCKEGCCDSSSTTPALRPLPYIRTRQGHAPADMSTSPCNVSSLAAAQWGPPANPGTWVSRESCGQLGRARIPRHATVLILPPSERTSPDNHHRRKKPTTEWEVRSPSLKEGKREKRKIRKLFRSNASSAHRPIAAAAPGSSARAPCREKEPMGRLSDCQATHTHGAER
jgi:hypothetical protein